jgi:hypothetical protein
MKTFVRSIIFTGAMAIGATGLMAAPASNDWFDQWYKTKYGRSSPAEEARLKAERDSTAFREEIPSHVAPARVNWIEEHYKAKLGRNSPAEEARLKAERENTAFREEPDREVAPAKTWFEEWHRAKYGRYPGK